MARRLTIPRDFSIQASMGCPARHRYHEGDEINESAFKELIRAAVAFNLAKKKK